MGKDFVMLDKWREVKQDRSGNEYIIVQGKRLPLYDLKNYVEVHNASWKEAIKERLKFRVGRRVRSHYRTRKKILKKEEYEYYCPECNQREIVDFDITSCPNCGSGVYTYEVEDD